MTQLTKAERDTASPISLLSGIDWATVSGVGRYWAEHRVRRAVALLAEEEEEEHAMAPVAEPKRGVEEILTEAVNLLDAGCAGRIVDGVETSVLAMVREALRLYREERNKEDERFELVMRNKTLYMNELAALKKRVNDAIMYLMYKGEMG